MENEYTSTVVHRVVLDTSFQNCYALNILPSTAQSTFGRQSMKGTTNVKVFECG